jgi:kynurenine formamidase
MPPTEASPRLGDHLLRREFEVVDLTREIYEGMPTYPFHQRPFIMVNQTHEESVERYGVSLPFETHNVFISEHTGTHTDAIFEYDADGATIERTPLSYYYGEAICLDLSERRYPEYFTPEVLEQALSASGQELRPGDTVLLYTGTGDRTYPSQEYLERYPGLSEDGARWLAEKGVANICVDALSIDHSDDAEASAHRVCKEFQIVNTESLTNLDRLVGKRFLYFGLPLLIRAGTGSPIRAVAVLGLTQVKGDQ